MYHSKKLMSHTLKFVVNITLNEHKIKCIDFYLFIFILLTILFIYFCLILMHVNEYYIGHFHWFTGGSFSRGSQLFHSSILRANFSSLSACMTTSSIWPHPIFFSSSETSYKINWNLTTYWSIKFQKYWTKCFGTISSKIFKITLIVFTISARSSIICSVCFLYA